MVTDEQVKLLVLVQRERDSQVGGSTLERIWACVRLA